jgi:hypothetical protein
MSQNPEVWPPRDVHVPLSQLVSHHVSEYSDRVEGADPMGTLTIGPHLVPLVDKVLEVAMRETAGQGANVAMHFDFINPDQPRDGGKLGIAYSGDGPSAEALEDETSELGRLRQLAIEAGGELALRQDDATGLPKIELAFPFWPNRG